MVALITDIALSGGEFNATGLSLGGYDWIELILADVRPSSNDRQVFVEISTADGPATGAHRHYSVDQSSGGTTSSTSGYTNHFRLIGSGAFDLMAADGVSGKLLIWRPGAAAFKPVYGQFAHNYTSANYGRVFVGGKLAVTAVPTAVRVFANSGTLASGKVKLLGYTLATP
ncbi:MAG: hypothetical protein WD046_13945 [Paracoccaceae bacterium]